MTATNHLLAGAAIAKFLPLPIAIPVALVSHFALDSIPHFGLTDVSDKQKRKKLFREALAVDFVVSGFICFWLLGSGHPSWLIAGLVAFSPDLVWGYRYFFQEKMGELEPKPHTWLTRFHAKIQTSEKTSGLIIELIVATGLFLVVR